MYSQTSNITESAIDFSNELHSNGCKFIISSHIEGSPFSVIFSVLQINNNLAAWCLFSIGRLL
jgi:hypothetical protein